MPEKLKVIVDTNLWVNFLITKRLVDLDQLLRDERLVFVFSQELLEEFIEVAHRPKFRKYFSESDIQNLLIHLEPYGVFAPVVSEVDVCRDAKDNFLLALAKDSGADDLVTKDDDLLTLGTFEKTRILDYFQFVEALKEILQ